MRQVIINVLIAWQEMQYLHKNLQMPSFPFQYDCTSSTEVVDIVALFYCQYLIGIICAKTTQNHKFLVIIYDYKLVFNQVIFHEQIFSISAAQ